MTRYEVYIIPYYSHRDRQSLPHTQAQVTYTRSCKNRGSALMSVLLFRMVIVHNCSKEGTKWDNNRKIVVLL